MEGVNHIDVVEVGGGGLVGDVDGVFQREIPHGESLELGVSGLDSALVFVVELREAYGHLAGAGAGGRDDDEGTLGLDVIVLSEAVLAGDEVDVQGIAVDEVVDVGFDAEAFEAHTEVIGGALAVVVGDHDGADFETAVDEGVAQAQDVLVVGDAEVGANLVFDDVLGADYDDDFNLVADFAEHAQLGVGLEAGQHAAGVVVVEKFASQLEIELAFEVLDAFLDVLRLYSDVLVVVKSLGHIKPVCRLMYVFNGAKLIIFLRISAQKSSGALQEFCNFAIWNEKKSRPGLRRCVCARCL